LKDLKKIFKIAVLVLADIIAVTFAYLFALFLRVDSLPSFFKENPQSAKGVIISLPFIVAVFLTIFIVMKMYRIIWHYAGLNEIGRVIVALARLTCSLLAI